MTWPDPSVLIALGTGVFALLTLVYNGWSQRRDKRLQRKWDLEDRQRLAQDVAAKVTVTTAESVATAAGSAARIAATLAEQHAIDQARLAAKGREHVDQVAEAATAQSKQLAETMLEAEAAADKARKQLAARVEQVRADLALNSATTSDVAKQISENTALTVAIAERVDANVVALSDVTTKQAELELRVLEATQRLAVFEHHRAKVLTAEGEAHMREADRIHAELAAMLPPPPAAVGDPDHR